MNFSDFVLRFRLGEGEWQVYDLLGKDTLIGRVEDNNLALDHREVSRHHLRIRLQDDVFHIVDLESSNGTRLDGVSLVPQIPSPLRPGQIIQVGAFSLVLEKSEEGSTHISREMLPYLIRYRFGTGTWQTFPLEPGEKILGRDPDCDFHLNDTEVSRRHARLRIEDEGIWITDLGSTNGTQVNGVDLVPHEEHPLQLGQTFSVGNFVLEIDEPSRFYQTPSAISGKPGSGEIPTPKVWTESKQTVFNVGHGISSSAPVRAINLLSRARITLGRGSNNDIVLNHPMVSRAHAVVERMETRFQIRDLRSTLGVFVNGKRIERKAYLKDWDQIQIGTFVFVLSGDDLEHQVVPGLKIETQNLNQQATHSLNLLQDVNLVIGPNEFVAIAGMSGSGKTTLLKALSGYRPASHGCVLVKGIDLYEHYDLFRSDMGYVPQKSLIHAELTPEAALSYTAQLRLPPDTTRGERKKIVSDMLEDLDLMECRKIPVSGLSAGQRKRVSMGCELLTKPRLYYLDEPTWGLDPGTEYDLMEMMRRLADQGRTVILITRATKNVMLCDKLIFLAQGGNLAFFGAPEPALNYFDPYRSAHERLDKEIDFDDIYRILNDNTRGTPSEWRERYLNSSAYQLAFGIESVIAEIQQPYTPLPAPGAARLQSSAQRVSGLRQFFVLSFRNLRVLARDRNSLTLMLVIAPFLGLMDFIWGRNLYDPVNGDASKIMMLWFMGALMTLMVGALSGLREIVKEADIYKHERLINLKIMPYILSKVGIGVIVGLYQAGVLLVFRYVLVNPNLASPTAFLAMFITFFLGITIGYLIGLLISALAPNLKVATFLIVFVLFLQFLFAGALIPLNSIPGGAQISVLMPSRWIFESFVRITELGEELSSDPCWTGFDETDRYHLSDDVKEECPCMGASIFTDCADFPGILSPNFYDESVLASLVTAEPIKPPQPTVYPSPTAILSSTPLATPTLLPSLTPYPTPRRLEGFSTYIENMLHQGEEYRVLVSDQFEQYRLDSLIQGEDYLQAQFAQADEYGALTKAQSAEYSDAMQAYSDERAAWQASRDHAIRGAEAELGSFYDNFPQVFQGSVKGRWVFMVIIQLGLFLLIILAQKRKDFV